MLSKIIKEIKLSNKNIGYSNLILFLIVIFFCWLILSIFFSERLPVNNGIGWDGTRYAKIAQHFSDLLLNHGIDFYALHRILPSAILYFISQLGFFQLTSDNLVIAFSFLNITALFFCVIIWNAIANQLHWTNRTRLMSFVAIFFSMSILKMSTYYPVLTDTTSFLFGFLLIYFLLTQRCNLLLLTAILGNLVNPILIYVGLILFVFPAGKKLTKNLIDNRKNRFSLALFLSASLTIVIYIIYDISGRKMLGGNYDTSILPVSIICLLIYLFFGIHPICNYIQSFLSILKNNLNFQIVFAPIIIIVTEFTMKKVASSDLGLLTMHEFIVNVAAESIAYPLNFIISHTLYFGPIIGLIIYYWREIVECAAEKSFGLFLITTLILVLSIGSESRQFTAFIPIIGVITFDVLNKKYFSTNFILIFTLISLVSSKVWLPLNHGVWPNLLKSPPEVTLAFPMQWYFMNQGPWVSHQLYFVNLCIATAIFFILYLLIKADVENEIVSREYAQK